MKFSPFYTIVWMTILFSCTQDVVVPDPINNCDESVIYFERDLLPLIVSSCATTGCHAKKNPKDGVRLNNIGNILKYVKPGNPEKSKLYKYLSGVISSNDDDAMPPAPNVAWTAQQIADIKKWIKDGAVLYDCDENCSMVDVTFNFTVTPIIQKYCLGCHSSNNASGNVKLNSYQKIKEYAINGQLMGTINHESGYSIMPPGGTSMSSCEIAKLQQWIDDGTLDN